MGGAAALGGGILVDNAAVTLTRVNVTKNTAFGAGGASGAGGATAAAGGNGGPAGNGQGGGIYVSGGTLTLNNDILQGNVAQGGIGGAGGTGGGGQHAGQPSLAQSGRPRRQRPPRVVRGAGGAAFIWLPGQVIATNDDVYPEPGPWE